MWVVGFAVMVYCFSGTFHRTWDRSSQAIVFILDTPCNCSTLQTSLLHIEGGCNFQDEQTRSPFTQYYRHDWYEYSPSDYSVLVAGFEKKLFRPGLGRMLRENIDTYRFGLPAVNLNEHELACINTLDQVFSTVCTMV